MMNSSYLKKLLNNCHKHNKYLIYILNYKLSIHETCINILENMNDEC